VNRIAFIGIGNMGAPMAAQLIEAGLEVTLYDVRPETIELFVGGDTE
jgi:3-hydroxyisobutyrate dehydrogenase